MRIVWGIIGILIGAAMIKWGEQIYNLVGQSATLEKYLGMFGGTRVAIRLIGGLLIMFSFLFMFGLLERMIGGCVSSVLPGSTTLQ
ncbi:MAG: hypothetical protein ABIE68_00120 [bacterium]